ncbi:MAG: hypothetical protein JNJ45_11350 [Chthonomonas sp.]|nr:hypothetical protein [Chthonomonas sp.]
MLWKPEFTTRIESGEGPPPLEATSLIGGQGLLEPGTVWVFGFDFQHIATWEIWARLLDDTAPGHPKISFAYVTPVAERKHLAVLDQCMPISRHRRTYLLSDSTLSLLKWSNFHLEEKVLAVIIRPDGTALRMHGLPTEDAWEQFETELLAVLNGPAESASLPPASGS